MGCGEVAQWPINITTWAATGERQPLTTAYPKFFKAGPAHKKQKVTPRQRWEAIEREPSDKYRIVYRTAPAPGATASPSAPVPQVLSQSVQQPVQHEGGVPEAPAPTTQADGMERAVADLWHALWEAWQSTGDTLSGEEAVKSAFRCIVTPSSAASWAAQLETNQDDATWALFTEVVKCMIGPV